MTSLAQQTSRSSYHHGNLQQTLTNTARELLAEQGIENLSLRKLALRVGVSRTAAYHHFDDKNALLCAIAAEGFHQRLDFMKKSFSNSKFTDQQKFQQFICEYIRYAAHNPEVYDLMFGRCIWKQRDCSQQLKDIAYTTFQYQLGMIKHWQKVGLIVDEDSLRVSQVLWGAMHGIAKLYIDGIYTDAARVEEISVMAVRLFTVAVETQFE
jgi:AcrR family transcriptional regulator